jgi:prepilin signal peptidase PulO-like enzyme (type II secretory pathway)
MSILSAMLGACVGSFLNVVIYRLPRGLSVGKPRRSFCPHCERPIAAYDNIPVLSFLWLRGRCRHCRAPISLQYPIVELVTALAFVATYDAFIIAGWRRGIGVWPQDGAIVAAHWILWAGLIATAVMDIEAYYLDIRVTWTVMIAGVVCHVLWTPASSAGWWRPGPVLAVGTFAGAAVLGLTGLVGAMRRMPGAADGAEEDGGVEVEAGQEVTGGARRAASPYVALGAMVLGLAIVAGYVVWAAAMPGAAGVRVVGAAGLIMVVTIVVAGAPREVDGQILAEIEAERTSARGAAVEEFAWLAPAIVAAIGAMVVVVRGLPAGSAGREGLEGLLNYQVVGQWRPVLGLATALCSWLIAGGLGWFVRIFFTVVLGKEALGVGDIHILAAAGAVMGWPDVVLGFFLSAPLALVATLWFVLRRRSRAIQYGPWLGLGFFLAAAFGDRVFGWLEIRALMG